MECVIYKVDNVLNFLLIAFNFCQINTEIIVQSKNKFMLKSFLLKPVRFLSVYICLDHPICLFPP